MKRLSTLILLLLFAVSVGAAGASDDPGTKRPARKAAKVAVKERKAKRAVKARRTAAKKKTPAAKKYPGAPAVPAWQREVTANVQTTRAIVDRLLLRSGQVIGKDPWRAKRISQSCIELADDCAFVQEEMIQAIAGNQQWRQVLLWSRRLLVNAQIAEARAGQ